MHAAWTGEIRLHNVSGIAWEGTQGKSLSLVDKNGPRSPELVSELEPKATEVAFPSVRGTPLSSDGLDYILQQAVKRAAEACPRFSRQRERQLHFKIS